MHITCSIALCGKEVDLTSAKNLWDYKENQLLAQPQKWLQDNYDIPILPGGCWGTVTITVRSGACWLSQWGCVRVFLWMCSLIRIRIFFLLSYMIGIVPSVGLKGRHLLPNCCLLLTFPSSFMFPTSRFLGLEKIISATVKPVDTRLLLSVWMKVSVDIEGNFSPSKIPWPHHAAVTSASSLGWTGTDFQVWRTIGNTDKYFTSDCPANTVGAKALCVRH